MRRGCIAVGKVECDGCRRPINYAERYLMINEDDDERQRLCIDCCQSRGYVAYGTDKGKEIVTFLEKE